MVTRKHKLTPKQRRFASEYQVDLNGTQAAIRAGYSPKTAEVIANHLVKKSWVSEAIKKQMEERLHRVGVQADKVLTRMARIGYVDIRKLYGPNNTLLDVKDWPDDVVPAVAGVETLELWEGKGEDRHLVGYTKKVRLWDPNPSLTNMAKNLGLIGNSKHDAEEDENPAFRRVMSPIELSAKIVYLVKIAVERGKKESEAQKALSGKSLDKNP